MRFPTIDDAAGVLLHLEDQVQESGGLARFSMLYDVARAHKLLPVKRRDWGFQAFRLPGSEEDAEDGDRVFLHTRGTFGIASAAYWWQRLAACLVRLCHRLAGRALGILHLLFADDGWMVATGSYFWRKCLFWLFEVCAGPGGGTSLVEEGSRGNMCSVDRLSAGRGRFHERDIGQEGPLGRRLDGEASGLRRSAWERSQVSTGKVRVCGRCLTPCQTFLRSAVRLGSCLVPRDLREVSSGGGHPDGVYQDADIGGTDEQAQASFREIP